MAPANQIFKVVPRCECVTSHTARRTGIKYVPQPQVHQPPDDARQRPQDTKDFHRLHQVILQRDCRGNRRHVVERE